MSENFRGAPRWLSLQPAPGFVRIQITKGSICFRSAGMLVSATVFHISKHTRPPLVLFTFSLQFFAVPYSIAPLVFGTLRSLATSPNQPVRFKLGKC
jgi:hypothetical protein